MALVQIAICFMVLGNNDIFAYENIALNKPTHQSKAYSSHINKYGPSTFDSSNAVDGLKTNLSAYGGQCVISADGQKTATWWVNLVSIQSIHNIMIYYRTDNAPWGASNGFADRFLGFYVYVSNTTSINGAHLCFHDTVYETSTIPSVVEILCPVHGQYVIYINKRPHTLPNAVQMYGQAHNELEVYGCNKTGFYGSNCSLPCPHNCLHPYCHIETGACQGCKPGYQGHQCELKCGNRTYGDKCMEDCGTCLGYKQCHHLNGSCLEGCDAGYEGDLCKTGCESGKFGINCKGNCNKNCLVPYVCNGTTGECEGGCQPGWEGLHCNKTCRNNRYGSYCNQSCGYCRDDAKCHHINGTCQSGCKQGYRGVNCTTECTLGTFGFDCKENCSKRCFETCNPVNGNCPAIKETSFQISNSVNFGIVISGIVGVIIPCLIVVIVVLVLKRRHSLQKNNSDSERTKTRDKSRKGVPETEFTSHDSNSTSTSSSGNKFSKTRNNNPRKSQKKGDEADVDDDEILHFENPYGDFYANEMTMWDIPLNQLESVITEKRMNENEGFQREYATLPYGELYKCDEGKKEENLVKNRYKTTFPYDHSRVILRTEANSGYINANYIEGSSRNNEYIATQGPKQNTLVDFWTMIWQENVSSIVMLTNLQEGTKMKCSQYWPDISKKNNYGTVNVKLMEEKMYAFYILRRMSVSHNESKKSRTVTQFHYTAWPDHGTPDPICLIVFLDHVNQTKTNQINSPTVIHCSAGLGRTGTYIALDTLEKIGRKTGKVNVAEYVKKMRESRMNMVQTYEQYMTVFLALNEIFKAPINNHTIEDFTRKAGTMTTDEPANHSALRKEFQLLMKIRPIYTDADFKIAKELCRDGPITGFLPLDKYIVYLSTPVTNRGSFINAIYVPSFTNNWAFIVTNYPSEGDAVDFLRLLCEQESSTVICMDPLNEIESCKAWLPSQTSSYNSVPPFTINFQSRTETDVCSLIVHIRQKNVKKPRTVTIIEPRSSIKTSGTPLDTSQFRSLVSAASSAETENPVIVVSSDGAVLCGAFCAVHNVIQQIYMDAMVDVFTNVRQLQVRRPEFCSSLEEYGLVMKAVNDHIQRGTENIYSNQ